MALYCTDETLLKNLKNGFSIGFIMKDFRFIVGNCVYLFFLAIK